MALHVTADLYFFAYRVYIYHGVNDNVVYQQAGYNTKEFYEYFISNTTQDLLMIDDIPSNHAVVSDHVGTPCGQSDHRSVGS